ncbi:TetR/AcrR family transcriptional regulator [Actinoplanes palleronii]|uniref:HTH-type transcriptional regulator YezE n=1 Tax=Actinoplanes palleronii TaxID=113570 RepID=A0ABQ4BFU5_9ACTN|nr:TetR/AcrR family transcriptional regulator [Actinoplanes palleronii]GIE69462.1 putative HTH-type transcriptional regulator YezE [Actinoplanes palleronii]
MARSKAFDDAAVVTAARDVFWANGYVASSLAQLQSATGLSKSSLYETYGSKRALFDRALRDYIDTVMSPFLAPLERPDAGPDDIVAFFRAFADYFRAGSTWGCLVLNTSAELRHLDDAATATVLEFQARLRAAFQHAARANEQAERHADVLTAWHLGLIATSRMDSARAIELAETIAGEAGLRLGR